MGRSLQAGSQFLDAVELLDLSMSATTAVTQRRQDCREGLQGERLLVLGSYVDHWTRNARRFEQEAYTTCCSLHP